MTGLNLSEWALKQRSLSAYLMIIAVAAGIVAYLRLGRSEDPSFVIKTMVVQAAWPGASVEETVKQVTERLERQLQETPKLDFLRSFTRAGVTTIFVNLKGSATAREIPDIWYHVRKSIGDIRETLPVGIVGPFFNDEFGDTFGIIYGFTAHGFTHRELRDYVEDIRSKLLHVPDVSKIEVLGAQDEKIFVEFSMKELASLGIDRAALIAALQAQNVVQPAGTIQTGYETLSVRVSVRAGCLERELRRRRPGAPPQRHRPRPARLFRSSAAAVSRQWRAGDRPCHCHARRRRHSRFGQEHPALDGGDHRRLAAGYRAPARGGSGGHGRECDLRIHGIAVAGDRHHPGDKLHQPRHSPRAGHRAGHPADAHHCFLRHAAVRHRYATHLPGRAH